MTNIQFEEENITDRANRLAREAVKRVMGKHQPVSPHPGRVVCSTCTDTSDGVVIDTVQWPCQIVKDMQDAEEAISVAEEEEEAATKVYYCPVVVSRARLYGDSPEPEEVCGNEVDSDGEPCPEHDEGNDEDEKYERWREQRLGL